MDEFSISGKETAGEHGAMQWNETGLSIPCAMLCDMLQRELVGLFALPDFTRTESTLQDKIQELLLYVLVSLIIIFSNIPTPCPLCTCIAPHHSTHIIPTQR